MILWDFLSKKPNFFVQSQVDLYFIGRPPIYTILKNLRLCADCAHTHTVFPLFLAQCAHSAFSRVDFVISQSKLKFDLKSGDFNCQKAHHNNKFAIVALLSRSCPLFPCLEVFFPPSKDGGGTYSM